MAKLTNVRERVHQPFRDVLVRTAGQSAPVPQVQDNTSLFIRSGGNAGETNLLNGSTLPSDQSMVVLALRAYLWFRNPHARSAAVLDTSSGDNGDYFIDAAQEAAAVTAMAGSVPGDQRDALRLYYQASFDLLWSFGTGEKISLKSMPTSYFPWGGGLHGDVGGATDLIFLNNGTPDHAGILRLARAILLPPRQNIICTAQIQSLTAPGQSATTFGTTQGSRSMLSLRDNLNAVDLISKNIGFCFDGLFSRDVQ